jgi:biopolymer transport protein ExbB
MPDSMGFRKKHEHMQNEAVRLFVSGGPVMFVLLGLSVLALAIILNKLYRFAARDLKRTGFIEEALQAVAGGKSTRAEAILAQSRHPVARVIEQALIVSRQPLSTEDRQAAVRRTGMMEIRTLESRLRGLELIGTVAPLLGLLGTVLGMIQAFAQVERFGANVNPALLAGGIWQALLTTAYGLTVAIPAMSVSYLLQNRVEQVREMMLEAATQTLSAASKMREPRKVS